MKKQIILLILIAFFNYTHSQNSKTGIIYYTHVDNHYRVSYNSYLVFNESTSYFVTAKDSLGLSNGSSKTDANNDEDMIVEVKDFNNVSKTRKEGLQVYLNKMTDSIYFVNAFSLTSPLIYAKEATPKLKWKFVNESKDIGGFSCKKAIANFRGREYICWYSEEIPLSYGPWKLQGLPGIILEARSNDGFFEIKFNKIKYPELNITVPSSYHALLRKGKTFISLEDYKLLQEKEILITDNNLRLLVKKHNVRVDPFSESDNFLEVFGVD